ncbi:sulfotransferase [Arhodomonas aquaeolei]|uniref:sulfotransferase n=1 Tax=Arhodomonas aquaeolei TaxID=2369 RepID=UPI00216A59ED|nr:sulfotransferase [Arhodomonas aquaeolei]MCS4503391.1 sulfotransferase [Arhodomonas aquaeolei]
MIRPDTNPALWLMRRALRRYATLVAASLRPGAIVHPRPRHLLTRGALLLAFPPFWLYHAVGLLLDEVLFRGYRRTPVTAPVFILGVPRSGTTALHAALAEDGQFTTFRAWECVFGVSVTWCRFWTTVGRLDRRLGAPLIRLRRLAERRLFAGLDDTHPVRADAPEEDYLVLLPVLWCFVLVVPFPDAGWLWRFAAFGEALDGDERTALGGFYRDCLRRHLHARGDGRRLLSKNAAFAPLTDTLLTLFPDARIIACVREPARALSSQLSCLRPSLRACHGDYDSGAFNARLAARFAGYYDHLFTVLRRTPAGTAVILPLPAQRTRMAASVRRVYALLSLPLSPAFEARLDALDGRARTHHSRHRHDAGDGDAFTAMLSPTARQFDYTATVPIPAHELADHRRTA